MTQLGIIDYGAGNLQSVANSLAAAGVQGKLIRSASDLENISHLVLPGVGAFGDCSKALQEQGLVDELRNWIAADKPFLGICIGYQILFESSEESPNATGLGIFKGQVRRFEERGLKIPHMGWNNVTQLHSSDPIWQDIPNESHLYYVHSYYPVPTDPSIIAARTNYGDDFAAAIRVGKLVATQFHPEKSQKLGIQLLRNFLNIDV